MPMKYIIGLFLYLIVFSAREIGMWFNRSKVVHFCVVVSMFKVLGMIAPEVVLFNIPFNSSFAISLLNGHLKSLYIKANS